MAHVDPPYFFQEFVRPARRKTPTERERTLGLTVKDLDWLNAVYYATDQARQDKTLRNHPMVVEKFILELAPQRTLPLAGTFLMSSSPDENKALLYTPYGGIEVFEDRAEAIKTITNRLNNKTQSIDLVRFLSIDQRKAFTESTAFNVQTTAVLGAVFEDQEATIEASLMLNRQLMLTQLRQTPTLSALLDKVLSIMGRAYFPNLDQRDTRVNSFMAADNGPGGHPPHWISSAPLGDVLLQYYIKQQWPAGQTRTFTHPRYITGHLSDAKRAKDLQKWESLVQHTAGILSKLLGSLLQTWWNEDIGDGRSRLDLFTQMMSDTLRADLLFKHQYGIVSAQENQHLLALFLPDPQARSAWHPSLRIEKVSIHAPYQHYVELAATLLISDKHAYLYTQSRGLQVLEDLADLNDTLLSMLKAAGHQDELLNFLSLEERSTYIAMEAVQVSGLPVAGSVFGGMVEDIAAKQLNNMEHALGLFRRSDGLVDLAALLDCALDIRHMLDSRLLSLDTGGRWSLHPVSSGNGRPSTVQAERAKQQLQTLQAAQAAAAEQRRQHPTLRGVVLRALNAQLRKYQLDVDASDIHINTYATEAQQREERLPVQSVALVDHFMERLARVAGPLGNTPHMGFYASRREGAALRWNNLTSSTVNAIVALVMVEVANHNVRELPRQFLEDHRETLGSALLLGLRSEAELRLLNKTLTPSQHAILDTVLRPDSMTRLKRHGLNGFLPDAYSLSLTQGDQLLHLANCWVLTERGGIDPNHSGQALLWTPQRGHEPFESVDALRKQLELRLAQPDRRLALLQNLPLRQRIPHTTLGLGPLQRIDGHMLDNRQHSYVEHLVDNLEFWLNTPLGPKQLQDCLDHEMQRESPSNLDRAATIAQAMIHQQALPVWLGMASPHEQLLHAELLEQYRLSVSDERDYLHSLPPLRAHVAKRLRTLLEARYPGLDLDPDDVLIPARIVLNGHTQSLTDFALRHLPDLNADSLKPSSRTETPLPDTFDGAAVVQLVRQLDIAATYRSLLNTHLTADTDDARQRRKLFCQQLPWQLLRHAHEEKLEERLSEAAWGFIQQIFDMPDAIAREQVSGASAMIRPLELIATQGAKAAKVLGVYLIGPQAKATGPLVLYAPYSPLRVLTEYASEQDLCSEINRPGPLQDWIIRQLGEPEQATYRNLLRPPQPKDSDMRLASNPIRGNILPPLFHDNTLLLLKMLACQFEREGKDQWDGITSLLRNGIPMALQFIAGKLKYPLVVWRSFKLFQASAEDLQQQRFSQGLRKFIQGLATLASVRKQLDELLAPQTLPEPTQPDVSVAATTIETHDITDPLRTRMRRFEDFTVALADLQQDPNTHVYKHSVSRLTYVPMAGRVYPVEKSGNHWRVTLARELGPYVERNAQGQWVLDLSVREPRFGQGFSNYRSRPRVTSVVRATINIEAQGRPAIRALNPQWDEFIDSALYIAMYYTNQCARNLALFTRDAALNPRTHTLLTEIFSIVTFTPAQLHKITARVDEVMRGLTDPTLTSPNSTRFVFGTNHVPDNGFAFTLPNDIEQTIFLVENFFNPRLYPHGIVLNAPFDIDDHARAATLIHEVSHMVCATEDIAYLDSMRPFVDLINVATSDYTLLSDLQSTALSAVTTYTELFTTWDSQSRNWVSLGAPGTTAAHNLVLRLTGTNTLNDARNTFLTNPDRRLDVILANADSVTYLITHVGRVLDPGA
ncbi:dermonecrotic toxin domain-containing protein [Pseudomonas sp. 18175]|uniref:dermonecrotic toxin domain-containing protein n=1 Tax=Pseudomonas sp. 18175 TaxID=3390056 RepID=UPI003D243E81